MIKPTPTRSTGPCEADAQFALQHRRRTGLRSNDQLARLGEHFIVVVARSSAHRATAAAGYVERDHVLTATALRAPRLDDPRHFTLRDPWRLEAPRDVRRGRHQQHVALADETLRARLVEDDATVRQ